MTLHTVDVEIENINPDNSLKIIRALAEFDVDLETATFINGRGQDCLDVGLEIYLSDTDHKQNYAQQLRDKIWAANGESCSITIDMTPLATNTITFEFKGEVGAA
jgi:hypothetical protein